MTKNKDAQPIIEQILFSYADVNFVVQSKKFSQSFPSDKGSFPKLLLNIKDTIFENKSQLIHRGNVPLKDSQGCILVGENKEVGKVLNSTYWEGELVKLLRYEHDVKISVVDA